MNDTVGKVLGLLSLIIKCDGYVIFPKNSLFDCINAGKTVSLRYGNSAGKSIKRGAFGACFQP